MMWDLSLPVFVTITLILVSFTEGTIYTQSQNLERKIGETVAIPCSAKLFLGDAMIVTNPKRTVAVVTITVSLDSVTPVIVQGFESQVVADVGAISATNPPYRNITITYNIDSVAINDSGIYECEKGAVKKTFTLTVVGPPTNIAVTVDRLQGVELIQELTYDLDKYHGSKALWWAQVVLDQSGNFNITAAVTADPVANVTWYKITPGSTEKLTVATGEVITVERMQPNLDGSQFICTAMNNYGEISVSVLIELMYKPRDPVISMPDVYPEEGKPLSIECSFDANPPATVYFGQQNPVTKRWRRISTDQSQKLYINAVQLDRDVGTYKCVGENSFGESEGVFRIHGEPKTVAIEVGTIYSYSADLHLTAFSAFPVIFNLTYFHIEPLGIEVQTKKRIDERSMQTPPNIRIPYEMIRLKSNTLYSLSLVAYNRLGNVVSSTVNFTTAHEGITRPATAKIEVDSAAAMPGYNGRSLLFIVLCFTMKRFMF